MGKRTPAEPRFWAKVRKTEGCWYWTGTRNPGGYGLFWPTRTTICAHRFAYELLVGPIPEGMTLDHECHNQDSSCPGGTSCQHRACVRPSHLVPRSNGENQHRSSRTHAARNAAKTHCPQGHPYDELNTRHEPGGRRCRACHRTRQAARRQRGRLSVGDGKLIR